MNYLRNNYLDQPAEVSLETLALCNAKCEFCTYPELERIGTSMSDDLISSVMMQLAEFKKPFFFSPFKVNEPFLDKRIMSILAGLNVLAPLARLRLFTNGSPLTLEKITQINELVNIEHLWVSLNSTDPVRYEQIMKIPFDVTARKLDMLHEFEDFNHLVVLSRVASLDQFDNSDFYNVCRTRWPKFTPTLIKRDGWLGDVNAPVAAIPDAPCSRWFELSICANGIVSLCCMDGHGKYAIGDIKKNSLLEIYNHPFWRERREKMMSRKQIFPCSTCSY